MPVSNLMAVGLGRVFPQPADPRLQSLMEPIALGEPCCPTLRWGLVITAFVLPMVLRPIAKALWNKGFDSPFWKKAGLARDALTPPLIGVSVYLSESRSIDCFLPEVAAGIFLVVSLRSRLKT